VLRAPSALAALAALGVLAGCGAIVEDAAASWGALFMRSAAIDASAGLAGLAFVAFQGTMTIGRLLGDRTVDRFGARAVVRAGGLLAAASMGLVVAAPSVATALLGYGLAGLGVATLVPASMHAADEVAGLPAGTGLTIVSWLLRVGFLLSPPVVGVVADAVSLRAGLLGVVVAGIVVAIVGRVLRPRQTAPPPRR
jgi:MFS family permease